MYEVGSVLAGKYRVDRVLGQGGMGIVLAATHLHLQQPVALKLMLDEMLHEPSIVERFVREARASAQLRSEHVCKVSDVGMLESGAPYIVMELLEGRDLSSIVSGNGPLPVTVATDYVMQACIGLAEAHARRIVHRDLKPANLFLTQRPDGSALIKVLDFGLAKATNDANFNLTRTAAVMGSPGYMSPEQLRSTRDADVRSDIWALGVILFELISGFAPFHAESITELALRVGMDPTPRLPVAAPPGFEAIVARCLEKDPARRFQDVANLAQALAPFGNARAHEVAHAIARVLNVPLQPMAPSAPTGPSTPTTLSAAAGAVQGPRKSRWGFVAAAVAVVVVAVVAIAVVASNGSSSAPVEPASTTPPPAAVVLPPTPPSAPVVVVPPPDAPAPVVVAPAPDAAPIAVAKPAVVKPTTKRPPPVTPKPATTKPPVSDEDVEGSRY